MKSNTKPHMFLQSLALAAVLTTLGASAMAQSPPASPMAAPTAALNPRAEHRMGQRDPAKMQAMMAKHQADLKANLKITPDQEGAWTTFTTAMQPPAGRHARPTPEQRADIHKLTTPQRIDKIRDMRTQRMADMNANMNKRGDATKALYAALTAEQQKVFDTQQKQHKRHGGHGGSHHQGRHG